MSRRILTLFAKAPVAGQVKTRLIPSLSAEQAAALYEAMLLDILDQHASHTDADRALWFSPPEARAWFEGAAPPGYRLLAQQGADLAARMRHHFRFHSGEGYGRIVLRGTDSPTLPPGRVAQAFDELERVDLVLCPDPDGGYNLIGLREPCDGLFTLEMSRAGVLEQTLARAREAGLGVKLLPPHHDVDTPEDLERLGSEVSESLAPRSLRWIRSLRGTMRS